jgi:cytochrome c oxidase cbb3-type subunit 3
MSDSKNERELQGHDYDGIRELDNPTPLWWQAVFYLTIAFGVGYFLYYMRLGGPTQQQELSADLKPVLALQQAQLLSGKVDPAKLTAMLKDPDALAKGATVFQNRCAVCHGPQGQGAVGPNLTDDFWLHGDGSATAILEVVRNGVADKGMPPWGTMLKPEEVLQAAIFVRSLRGTRPANPKAPQGTEYHEPAAAQ